MYVLSYTKQANERVEISQVSILELMAFKRVCLERNTKYTNKRIEKFSCPQVTQLIM